MSKYRQSSLEIYDFCKLARMAIIVTPCILLFEYGLVPTCAFFLVLYPIMDSYDAITMTAPILLVFGLVAAVVLLVLLIIAICRVIDFINDHKTENNEPEESNGEIGKFAVEAFWSFKKQFCPIVEFKDETE